MNLPIALVGFVAGPLRLEAPGGEEFYPPEEYNKVLWFYRPWPGSPMGKQYAVTHLQKRSRVGFLLMRHDRPWQLCWHQWLTIRYQEKSYDGSGIPGTETVLYWRVGYSRWDAGDGKYVQGWIVNVALFNRFKFSIKIPFGTWYGPGLHWD